VTIAQFVCALIASTWALSPSVHRHALSVAQPNTNTTLAGRLHDGVLDIEFRCGRLLAARKPIVVY
jgi:hypothetical protein